MKGMIIFMQYSDDNYQEDFDGNDDDGDHDGGDGDDDGCDFDNMQVYNDLNWSFIGFGQISPFENKKK